MKRSFINKTIDFSLQLLNKQQIFLPKFAYYTYTDWKNQNLLNFKEIFDLELGWDLTDFGSGNFSQTGLTLFTLRNGSTHDKKYSKSYAEKFLISYINQETPFHYHYEKMEDIVNRGGGILKMQIFKATKDHKLNKNLDLEISIDGEKKYITAGEIIVLHPGESVTIPQFHFHRFWAENDTVLAVEISTVNDDYQDNHFLDTSNRFADIEEDEPIKWLLCNEYKKLNY